MFKTGFWNSGDKAFRMAAPVGVVISVLMLPANVGIPCSSNSVAGAGTGSLPWAQFTKPDPVQMGVATTAEKSSSVKSRAAPTISIIESTAPTS